MPENGQARWTSSIVAAVLAGGSGAVVVPWTLPDVVRPNPFTSLDWDREASAMRREREAELALRDQRIAQAESRLSNLPPRHLLDDVERLRQQIDRLRERIEAVERARARNVASPLAGEAVGR